MGIDTGLTLHYDENFPNPNVNQPSQQFRDNFSVIKAAVESLQAASNSSASNFTVSTSQNSNGIVHIDVTFPGGSFTLPFADPTIPLAAGMLRFYTGVVQVYDGTGWRPLINKDAAGNVSLSTLTVTNKVTLGYDPVSGTDAVRLSYLNTTLGSFFNSVNAVVNTVNAVAYATQGDLNGEKVNRVAGDAYLQSEIDAINNQINNASATSASVNAQLSNLSNAILTEANTRSAADTSQLNQINSLTLAVANAQQSINSYSLTLNQEIADRQNADNAITISVNSVSTSLSLTNQNLLNETNARVAADLALANSIADINNSVAVQSNAILITGGTMTGDLVMANSNITVNNGTLTLSNSALLLPKTNLTLDANQYFLFNAIPNLVGGNDGAFITYDQNNFSYARMDPQVASDVSNSIIANGIANTNAMYEFSCLRFGTTNDFDDGINGDSIAFEPAADLWLNPGWGGGGVPNTANTTIGINPEDGRIAILDNASVYVGNATSWTIRMVRQTGDIYSNGSITAAGDLSGLSDASLKENVKTIENSLDKIDALRGVIFNRNDLPGYPEQMGVIAQETQAVVPQVVHETENGLLSVSYGNLAALFIEAIKDLRQEINEIKKKIP